MRAALLPSAVAASLAATLAIVMCPDRAFATSRAAAPVVVVELFTAQGCDTCPQANRLLTDMADRKGVLMLMFPVDYWDYAGWRDTFARSEFTERQRAYARRLKVREIYTPEIVVDGRAEAPGLDKARIDALLKAGADKGGPAPLVRLRHGARDVAVTPRPGGGAVDVWLVRYDPAEHDVRVKSGDNKGKLLPQRDVVRELTRLGRVSTRPRTFALPADDAAGFKTAVLVQGVRGGPILTVAPAN